MSKKNLNPPFKFHRNPNGRRQSAYYQQLRETCSVLKFRGDIATTSQFKRGKLRNMNMDKTSDTKSQEFLKKLEHNMIEIQQLINIFRNILCLFQVFKMNNNYQNL